MLNNTVDFKAKSFLSEQNTSTMAYEVKAVRANLGWHERASTVLSMLNINPKKTYFIGFWPGEGGGRVLCVHSTDTIRVFESKNDAQSAAGCLPTPLQLVEVLGENLLTAGQPLLLEGGRFAQSAEPLSVDSPDMFRGSIPCT